MTVTLTRPAWTTALEIEIFNELIDKHAPHLPKTRLHEPRSPQTPEELNNAIFLVVYAVCLFYSTVVPQPLAPLNLISSNS